jgi:hypothetical protein
VRFEIEGPIRTRGLCLCRSCQTISGGGGNYSICGRCGVHLAARSPRAPGGLIVKVGALDDPAVFEGPRLVVWTEEKQDFHVLPDRVAAYPRMPGR